MIYYEYEIWTDMGWEKIKDLKEYDKIMIFNLKNRMAFFREIGKIKTILSDENVLIQHNTYKYIFNKNTILLNKDYKKIKVEELENNTILTNAGGYLIGYQVKKINEKLKFYSFSLDENEFVYIKNIFPLYYSFIQNIDNKVDKKIKIKNREEACDK